VTGGSNLNLTDTGDLNVAGKLTASSITIVDTGTLTVSNSLVATSAVSLTAGNIAIPGSGMVSDGGSGTTSLVANAGTINEAGTLIAGTLSGSAGGSASLAQSGNLIGTLGNFNAAGGFGLADGTGLTVTGSVNGGPTATLLDKGTLTIASGATVAATAISLTADSITIPGKLTDGGSGTVSLVANTGTISETGTVIAGTMSGSAAGSANFSGANATANQIAAVSNFTASGFALNDAVSLTVSGGLRGGPGVTLVDKGILAIASGGSVAAAAIALNANDIAIAGLLSDGGAGAVNLVATTGAISETGTIIAGSLSGSATGAASFNGASRSANQIASLGNFTASNFALSDGASLAINGTVNGGATANIAVNGALTVNGMLLANTIGIDATGGIAIRGIVQDANSVSLISGASIDGTGGTLIADLLSGSAAGSVTLTGSGNQVLQLGSFTTASSFVLNDATELLISGPLTAGYISINTGSRQISFGNGAMIAAGGFARPSGVVTNLPSASTTTSGAYLTAGGFIQRGDGFVVGLGGGPNILRIDVSGSGNIIFDAAGGLHGPATWLILGIDSGRATGNVAVKSFDIARLGSGGSAELTGSVNGLTGPSAASAAAIRPSPSSDFRFNSCAVHSVNCVLLPTEGVPTANPLNDISIGSFVNPDDQDDLLLPIVSDRDY
jgi:hypothetical protein